jgi:hypothetical protein
VGLIKTKVRIRGGGPCDGDERVLPNGQKLILVARAYLAQNKTGSMDLIQDTMCAHAYVRLDTSTFAYDGLRIVEADQPVPVEMRSFT